MKHFFRSVICQHIWFTFEIELHSCTQWPRCSYKHVCDSTNDANDTLFNIFTMTSSLSTHSAFYCMWNEVNTLLAKAKKSKGCGTETLYNLWLIHFKFSLWSHIKLPWVVIISVVYRYRLHNFIDINRILDLIFPFTLQ